MKVLLYVSRNMANGKRDMGSEKSSVCLGGFTPPILKNKIMGSKPIINPVYITFMSPWLIIVDLYQCHQACHQIPHQIYY